MAYTILDQQLPVRAAGGGQPSNTVANMPLEPFSENVISHLISAHKETPSQDGQKFGDETSWLSYMTSDKSNAMSAPRDNDLNYSMSSYFISSSHNTYLSGNQLYGDASVEAYTNVLRRDCRCLEIDVWDGETDFETSTSDEGEDKPDTKQSRWGKVKASAARLRSHSLPRSPGAGAAGTTKSTAPPTLQASSIPVQADFAASSGQRDSPSYDPKNLSPQPSQSLPPKVEPKVLHGHTLTQSITFRSVCHAIRDSAFVSTNLPLIVSLEVHASLSQQEVMVEIIREVWSDYLVCLRKGTEISSLPPPNSLKNKILIKVKWTPNTETGESNDPIDHVNSQSTDSAGDSIATSPEKRKKTSKVLVALSELGIYTRAYSFKQFSQPEAAIPNHVFSLSEDKIRNMHSDPFQGPSLFHHNKNFLLRVFPRGTRINSSNVDPAFHWRAGAQMVALNWQKLDKAMMLNEGMFAGTGGWCLKPEGYRYTGTSKPQEETQLRMKRLNLEIRLLAAQRLPVAAAKDDSYALKLRPYVKAQLHVHPAWHANHTSNNGGGKDQDERESYGSQQADSSLYKCRSATNRTDSPNFGSETMRWNDMPDVIQELSFIRYAPTSLASNKTAS